MTISPINSPSGLSVQTLVGMRDQLNDLQRQLSTGQKSATYAGLGLNRGLSVSLNAQLSQLKGYSNTIDNVNTRTSLMSTVLGRMTDINTEVKSAMVQANSTSGSFGSTVAQQTAQTSLDELLGLLNTQAGDRFLFSGKATGQKAVVDYDTLINGSGTQAGLKQLISERTQADIGTDGQGRVDASTFGNAVTVSDDATPFGMKIASATSTLTNAVVTPSMGPPNSVTVDFSGGVPNNGDTITLRLTLPDGSTSNLTLTATTNSPPAAGQFTIDPSPANTAANFNTALNTALAKTAGTDLTAASAVAASNDFFDATPGNPPQRVDGPPFDSATGFVPGTTANTVIWYTGEDDGSPARSAATAQVDQSLSVSYGARADEQGIRNLVQNVATLAAVTISSTNPNGTALSLALNQRLSANLNDTSGQTVTDIQMDVAAAQSTATAAKSRQSQTTATLQDFITQVSGVSNEEVGSEILALQTRMQASMQTTAILAQLSLVNYLK